MNSRVFFLAFILLPFTSITQVKDKNWLLTDSVKYEKIDPKTQRFLDSLLTLYHKAKHDTSRISLLLSIVEGIQDDNIWTHYNKLAFDLSCKGNDKTYLKHKSDALNNMGFHAQAIGDNKGAIDLYSQSLSIREKIAYKEGIANSLNNLAYVFDDLGDIEKAEDYYLKALIIREQTGEKTGLVNTLNNLSTVYYEKKEYKKAEKLLLRAIDIAKTINFKGGLSSAYSNLGNIYSEWGDQRKALEYQEAGMKYKTEILDEAGMCGTYLNFANIYSFLNETEKAKEYALKALELSKKIGFAERTRDASWTLYRCYKKTKKFEDALSMYILYVKMRDSVNNEAVHKASIKQQFKYEYEKKEASLKAEQEKKDAIASEESRRQKLFLIFIASIAIVILGVALFVVRSLRITQRQKRIIEKQKQIVEEKQKEILDSIHYAKRIQKALLPSEKFIGRNIKPLQ